MKLSVSLTDEDVALLDDYVRRGGLPSRSAALQQALRRLRQPQLEDEYAAAWDEWDPIDRGVWEHTAGYV